MSVLALLWSAVSDIKEAKKLQGVVNGGYESLLKYQKRDNCNTFITKEAYVEQMSLEYNSQADNLRSQAKKKGTCCIVIIVSVLLGKKGIKAEAENPVE